MARFDIKENIIASTQLIKYNKFFASSSRSLTA